jgi:SAM-dependent methyltransferase
MNLKSLGAGAARRLSRFRPQSYWHRQGEEAKAHWLAEAPTNCPNAGRIYDAAQPATWRRVLEFGANTGGNLTYFLDRHPGVEAVGIDINPIVKQPESSHATYRGIVGDESTLAAWAPDSVDLAFTISVLDHVPAPAVAERILNALVTIAPKVVLIEPAIPGVHGDVSGRTRGEIARDLPAPHKRFAAHSYVWDYERWLSRLPVSWTSRPEPLHAQSLGPFYRVFVITRP